MEYASMKEWLDKIIDAKEHLKSLEQFNSRICSYGTSKDIPIEGNIEEVADTMGVQLQETKTKYEEYPYKYNFYYRGYEIYQLREERLESFAGTN